MKKVLHGISQWVLPHLVIGFMWTLRLTCRVRPDHDPRPGLRAQGQTYIYASLHAHQVAMAAGGEHGTAALVSRSRDGNLIARALVGLGMVPIRGSAGARRKGGATALRALVDHVQQKKAACLMVDGPKGPRNKVSPGIALLSQKTGVPVIAVCVRPSFRIVMKRTWDRTQVPLPFSKIQGAFSEPMYSRDGESVEQFTHRIQETLTTLEREFDPDEAKLAQPKEQTPALDQRRAA